MKLLHTGPVGQERPAAMPADGSLVDLSPVTADEAGDPQRLGLRTWVNGELRRDGSTKDMVFGVRHLVWYTSQFMVLEPGDVIDTGTPVGVALGRPDHPYLQAGDLVELEIDGLGRQRQRLGQA